ncbi:cytochrome P450 2G1 isoform X2 [Bombina bombina]|uniref:cytochrome P450 2G1 isoform X2 n=1 Tax=Bombina bombina TaxID=8345 RepID=UPI00235AB8E8|nr:cytochrome P450 2G1 isoform X2 [Bombina bombina]
MKTLARLGEYGSSFKTICKRGNLPPGPTPLPILGNILQLKGGEMAKCVLELRKKYGDLFTVYFGSRPVVIVSGYKMVKEILVERGDEFLARGDMPTFDTYYKNYGFAFTNDMNRWKDLRRFSLITLRDFGMGKRSVEDRIIDEARCLVVELKNTKESFLNPRQFFNQAACNIIFSIMFGNRCDYENEDLNAVLTYIYETFVLISSIWGQIFDMFPRLMRILPGPHTKILSHLEKLLKFVEKKVKINQETLDPNNPRDYVDVFLIKLEKEKNDPHTDFNMTNLICSTLQIFFAGVETISTTLTYSLLILMKYPKILANVQDEIDKVIGQNRVPKLQDRNQMPYTEAVIHEIQRYIDLIPMGAPRKTTQDVQFKGYTLPKGTNVFPMLGSVLRDPACFPYPTEFNPQNFLTQNGDFQKNDAFMPLSAGKRICVGEALVRTELFLFFVTILQNFDLKSPVPREELDITPEVSGLGNFPKPYKVALISR